MANKGWVDNGGSVGCESPGAFPDYDLDAKNAGEPWPQNGRVWEASQTIQVNPSHVQCLQKKDGFACTLLTNHAGSHKAYGIDELIREWPSSTDLINHPPHYTFGKIEVIDVIEDWGLSFHLAQVVKYVARAKHKGNELEDLRKARFYLNRLITSLEPK